MFLKTTFQNYLGKKWVLLIFVLFTLNKTHAQNGVAINTTGAAANSSAMLDVSSTTSGILITRMTSAQRAAISSPATGLMVYQTDGTDGFYYYTGSVWNFLASSGNISNITLGQSASTIFSTGSIVSSSPSGFTLVPNLSTSVTIPSNGTYSIYIATDGGIQTRSGSAGGYSVVDVAVAIDGVIVTNGLYQRIYVLNSTTIAGSIGYWSMSSFQNLSSGTSHNISVYAVDIGNSGSGEFISGDQNSVLQGQLTVTLIKQ
jgi:hypothetical protein